jgi:hypothetical protein
MREDRCSAEEEKGIGKGPNRLAATQACLNVQAEGDTQKRVLVLNTLLYTLGMILRQCVHTSAFTLNVRVHMHMALKAILVPFSDKSKPFLPSPHD